ncbi:hypothetical protein H6F88_20300 [Oculatella sp. FACHB-28]|uniref:hypothetical protein n=1 Tax=Oculatella sp. FACHB-28 TaxID=2692845 RepID=UPI00198EFBC0|nr:hypothetical protein [Oculatella sp. FACHB-28]MBD2058309.1 hypothetical protein [Oculatella sp. FACHB-28]
MREFLMRWLVEIRDVVADKRFLSDLLEKLNVTLYVEDNKTYLISKRFELLSTSSEVLRLTKQICTVVSEVSNDFPDARINLKLGDLYEQREDGSRCQHVFRSSSTPVITLSIQSGRVTPVRGISEEAKAKLRAERLEHEYQVKLALVSHRIISAFHNEHALKVHRLLQQELTPIQMHRIYELMRNELGEKLNDLASKKNWDRFTHSVNHPGVFGDESRHMVSNKEPPAKPMYLEEAQNFISKAANLWFHQIADRLG